MPAILQGKLIRWILHPLSRITERIPHAVWDTVFSLCILVFILMHFANLSGLYTGRFFFMFLIGCFLFGVMILAGLTPGLKPVRFPPFLIVCWLGVAVFMLLTGLFVETNALAGAILWLAVLPVFYIVWSPVDFDRLATLTIRGVLCSYLVFVVVSVFFYPVNSASYSSFFANRNSTGMYLTAVFTCLLLCIFSRTSWSWRTIPSALALGFAAATIYYTGCRTAIVASFFCFLSTALIQLYIYKRNWRRVFLCQLLPIIAAVIFLQPVAIRLYQGGYRLTSLVQTIGQQQTPDTPVPPPDASAQPPDASAQPPDTSAQPPDTSAQPPDAPAQPPDTPAQPPEPSASDVLDEIKNYTSNRLGGTGKILDDSTEARVMLWTIHLREAGLLGNPSDKVLYRPNGRIEGRSAHFTIIQFAYDYGALSGVSLLLFNIFAGLLSIRFALKRRNLKYALFPYAIAIAFGAESVMEAIGNPMIDSLSLLYFLSLTPLMAMPPDSIPAGMPKPARKESV